MKTKSNHSVAAALLGVSVILHVSANAGPDPQPEYQSPKVSERKNANVTHVQGRKAPANGKAVVKSGPKLTRVSGPRGDHFIYRW
jgi:hypothetical protein